MVKVVEGGPRAARVTTNTALGWGTITASAHGADHRRRAVPNQDAVATSVAGSDGLVVALSDGHGAARYVRSAAGAHLAVALGTSLGAELLPGAGRLGDLAQRVRGGLVPTIAAAWREAVNADAKATPFTADERAQAAPALLDDDPPVAYGATLLLALVTSELVVVAQIGDGEILVAGTDGLVTRPLQVGELPVGGLTASLCLPSAAQDVRVAARRAAEVDLLALASDGYGNAFGESRWHQGVVDDLRRSLRDLGHGGTARLLPDWLADSAEVGGDDVTVAILARLTAQPSRHGSGKTGPGMDT